MRRKSFALVLIFSVLSFTLSCSNSKKVSAFTEQVDTLLLKSGFQGQVLVARNNKVICKKGCGTWNSAKADSPVIDSNTVFEAGSLTKQITAAAILQLDKKKKLSIDDKLSKYYPEYKYGDQITLRMLLNMRSGLTDCINAGNEYFPKYVLRQIEELQLKNQPVDEDIVVKYLYDAPLLAPPDSTYFYCNTNYVLLAKIIEKVSGLSYKEYIQRNIFKPCKMNSANLNFQDTDAVGYDYKGRYYSIPSSLAMGCGDLNASAEDLLKWNQALVKGKVISKKQFKQMIETEGSYGFGIYHKDNMIFHGGTTNVFNAYNCYYLDSGLSIIVLSNTSITQTNTAGIAGKIYKLYENLL